MKSTEQKITIPALVNQRQAADLFGVHRTTIYEWSQLDTFKEASVVQGSKYDLRKLILWREGARSEERKQEGGEKRDLEMEKLRKEIELKDIQIQKEREAHIDIETHEQILTSRMASLKQFLTHAFVQNVHRFHGKNLDELRTIAADFAKQALAAYTGMAPQKKGAKR